MTTEYLLAEIAEKNNEIAELKRQLTIRDELLCQTCHGHGSVMIAIDDGIDCPECVERDNEIKADGIIDAIADTRSEMVHGSAKWLCRVLDLEEYAEKIRNKS